MDLTKQPPRRPSNANVGGITGLARMIDKARGHNSERIGEFKYGAISGLDVEVLEFINMGVDEFAEAVEEMDDKALGVLVVEKANKSQDELDAYNREHLEREPQDPLHEQLLLERVAKFAPGRTDITTVFASIELDDWGAFRDLDLTAQPPRSPYVRSVFGLVAAARMADKARAVTIDKLGDYRYGSDSSLDLAILDFIGVDQEAFREAAYANPNDVELSEWIAERCDKPAAAKSRFNVERASVGRYGEMAERLAVRRAEVAPERGDIETFFDLQDLDDEQSFGRMDLSRHAPRSPFDLSVGGMACLARVIDKFRASNCNCMGEYWCGEDSGFDRAVLEFLGVSQEEFVGAVAENGTDEAMVAWLGDRLGGKSDAEKAEFSDRILSYGPGNDQAWAFLRGAISRIDSSRTDIETFSALTLLDDKVFFARFKAGV